MPFVIVFWVCFFQEAVWVGDSGEQAGCLEVTPGRDGGSGRALWGSAWRGLDSSGSRSEDAASHATGWCGFRATRESQS